MRTSLRYSLQGNIKKILTLYCAEERDNFILWIPVLIGIGIGVYFATESKYFGIIIATITILSFLSKKLRYLSFCMCFISIGFFDIWFRINRLSHIAVQKEFYLSNCAAKVEKIENFTKHKRFLLSEVKNKKIKSKYIRLTARGKVDPNIRSGDIISISAVIKPLPLPAMHSSYNFAKFAFFEQIGAIGFIVKEPQIIRTFNHPNISEYIMRLREKLNNHLINIMGQKAGSIASALLVGRRESIDANLMFAIRNSGLAHLLAVSGLHIGMISGFIFILLCTLLALSEYLALHFNVRKIAAFISILCSFIYLLISGAAISAQRAFIMTSLFFLAIIFNRTPISMRSVAFAAFVILLLYPESVLKPSFQMSFAAVISLISFYNFAQTKIKFYSQNNKFISYFKNVSLSSLVATSATSIYSIYHFNNFAIAGLISNFIAVPLAAFWIMPIGIIAICCMSFTDILFHWMKYGIDLLIYIAENTSQLPYASLNIPEISNLCLCFITMGGLWLCLWKSKIRSLGVLLIIFGIFLGHAHTLPDILINEKMAAVRLEDNKLYFLKKVRSNFVNKVWMQHNGQNNLLHIKQDTYNELFNCDQDLCVYNKDNKTIIFTHNDKQVDCDNFDLVINLHSNMVCGNSVNNQDLLNNGTYAIYISENKITLINSRGQYKKI